MRDVEIHACLLNSDFLRVAPGASVPNPTSSANVPAGRARLADIKQAETVLDGSLIRILDNRICPVIKRRLKPISLGLPLAGTRLLRLEEGKPAEGWGEVDGKAKGQACEGQACMRVRLATDTYTAFRISRRS